MVSCPVCNTAWDFAVKFCGECGYEFKLPSRTPSQQVRPKPAGGICKVCKSRNLKFNDDGTGVCLDCKRQFVWSKITEKKTAQTDCPVCKKPATYIKEYDRWYCYDCKKYVPKRLSAKPSPPQAPLIIKEKKEALVKEAPVKETDETAEAKFRELEAKIESFESDREALLKELTVQKRTVERAKERLDAGEITKRTYDYIKKKREKLIAELDEKIAAIDEKLEDAKIELEVKEEVELGIGEEEEEEEKQEEEPEEEEER